MKKSQIKPDMIVVSRYMNRGRLRLSARCWKDGQGYLAKVVAVGNFRYRRDAECNEVLIEESEFGAPRAHVLVLPDIHGDLDKIDVDDLDWSKANPLLATYPSLRSLEESAMIAKELAAAAALDQARNDRIALLREERDQLLSQAVDKMKLEPEWSFYFYGDSIQMTGRQIIQDKDWPAATRKKLIKLNEEITKINSCRK